MRPAKPEIRTLPEETVLTVRTVGNPNTAAQSAISALYGTAYGTKFKRFRPKGKAMAIGCLACEWPNAHVAPKSKWIGNWSLEVSPFVKQQDLIQKDPKIAIRVAKRKRGPFAQVLYLGSYAKEGPTIKMLHAFIAEQGYALAGPHEEVYLTKPSVKQPKTIIRYRIRKAQ